jgi:hypothetical protein
MSSLQVGFSNKFLVACLRLGVHVEGLVDSYYGPKELVDLVSKDRQKPLGEILIDLEELKKEINSEPFDQMRKTFIIKQIMALQSTARERMGVKTPYREYVSRTLDIEAKDIKEQDISELRRDLEALLKKKGYQGSLADMLITFRKRRLLSGERLRDIFYNLVAEAKAQTMKVFNLPPAEQVDFAVVNDMPWSSDNKYLGNYRSLVTLNTSVPVTSTSLPITVTHQTYPGHHTEHILKELELFSARNQLEASIILINTPESTMSEGLAETSRKFILGEPAMAEDRIQQLEARFRRAVRVNAALMIHEKNLDVEEAMQYFMEEGGYEKKESKQGMRFVLDPLWRTYLFTFYEGERMISEAWRHAKEAGKEERFLKILYQEENCPTTFKEKVRKLLA